MLILTRSQNESIIINDDIKITVISDRHGQVKLGTSKLLKYRSLSWTRKDSRNVEFIGLCCGVLD